jgi:predicted RNase H-like HicB family nuclease
MSRYLIVIEKTASGFSAYSPDLTGCAATGATRAEVEREMKVAVEFHVDGLKLAGYEVPEPKAQAAYCEAAA